MRPAQCRNSPEMLEDLLHYFDYWLTHKEESVSREGRQIYWCTGLFHYGDFLREPFGTAPVNFIGKVKRRYGSTRGLDELVDLAAQVRPEVKLFWKVNSLNELAKLKEIEQIVQETALTWSTVGYINDSLESIVNPKILDESRFPRRTLITQLARDIADVDAAFGYYQKHKMVFEQQEKKIVTWGPSLWSNKHSATFFPDEMKRKLYNLSMKAAARYQGGMNTIVELAARDNSSIVEEWAGRRIQSRTLPADYETIEQLLALGKIKASTVAYIQQNLSTLVNQKIFQRSCLSEKQWVTNLANYVVQLVSYYQALPAQERCDSWSPITLFDSRRPRRYASTRPATLYQRAQRDLQKGIDSLVELAGREHHQLIRGWTNSRHLPFEEYLSTMVGAVDEKETLATTKKRIQAYGTGKFFSLTTSSNVMALLARPPQWYAAVTVRQLSPEFFAKELSGRVPCTMAVARQTVPAFDRLNQIKLARDKQGGVMPMSDYFCFTQRVFDDQEMKAMLSLEATSYLEQGDFRTVSIIEEVVDPTSRNPNFRMRMFLATNPVLKSTATLDAFVKFYPGAAERDLEAALNNYLHDVAQVSSVGKARVAQLQKEVKVQRQESGDYTYTLLTADAVRDRHNANCGYALITPFVNLRSVEDCIVEDKEGAIPLLRRINTALRELHTRGIENVEKISEVDGANVLREHLKPVDYSKQKYRFMKPSGELDKVVSSLGIFDILNQSAASYPSLIHGDPHPRNIGLTKNDEVILLDFESEFTGIGASQIDIAKLYRHRSLELGMKDKEMLVHDYMQQRMIPTQNYLLGFHAAMVYTTLWHMRQVKELVGLQYTFAEARAALVRDSHLLWQHTTEIYGRRDAQKLVAAAQHEFMVTG